MYRVDRDVTTNLPRGAGDAAESKLKHDLSEGLLKCKDKLMRLNDIHLVLLVEHTVMIEKEKEIKVAVVLQVYSASACFN